MVAGVRFDGHQLTDLARKLRRRGTFATAKIMHELAPILESQTRRRLQSENTDPLGRAWTPWSPQYAKTRRGTQSLLQSRGRLMDSIEAIPHKRNVEWGSNLVYAKVHDEGGAAMPQREYLGISDDNAREIDAEMQSYLERWF